MQIDPGKTKLKINSLLLAGNTGGVSRGVSKPRVSKAMRNYGEYMQVVIQVLFKRPLLNSNEIIAKILSYLEVRNRLIFKIVVKELLDASFMIKIVPSKFIKITPERINELPLYSYEGPIEVISSLGETERVVSILAKEKVLGFDTETRPSFKKGVHYLPSLLQLASSERAYIFLLQSMTMEPFKPLLENKEISKVGIGVRDDIKGLQEIGPFKASGFIDIAGHKVCGMIENRGLRPLAAYFLKCKISKNEQMSNWAKPKLTESQIRYAATDAWVSLEIYLKLEERFVEGKK